MKALTLIACTVVTFTSCNCQKKAAENNGEPAPLTASVPQEKEMPVLQYEANTRGFFLTARLENQVLYTSRDRDAANLFKSTPISDSDWKEIEKLAKAVDLEKVKDLKWPTEKRFYDGAAHANIIFSVGRAKYTTPGFDHGYPPAEIAALVNKIVSLAEKTE